MRSDPPTLARSAGPRRRVGLALTILLASLLPLTLLVDRAGADTDPTVVDALERDGRYVSGSADAALGAAIDRANGAGVAFAWLDQPGDETVAADLADEYALALDDRGSPYRTVLLVVANGYGASSLVWSQSQLDTGLNAAFDGFSQGTFDRGVDAFVGALPATTTATTTGTTSGTSSSSGGGGPGLGTILLLVVAAGALFLVGRSLLRRRRARRQAAIHLADDKAEIEEQLKNNADRVIDLGDRVIARGDRELIVMYEEASATYQDVSGRIDTADGAEEIDELDDRIDHAEWQFEVIEARLDNRQPPPPPTPTGGLPPTIDPSARAPGPDAGAEPADGQPPVVTSPRTGRTYPTSVGTGRSSGRGGSGGLGGLGGLGGVLADIVLGGGLGGLGGGSRRTQRRVGSGGLGGGLGGGGLGGLGGGVIRRGSPGAAPRTGGRSSRSSGGRPLGGARSRSRGGRRI